MEKTKNWAGLINYVVYDIRGNIRFLDTVTAGKHPKEQENSLMLATTKWVSDKLANIGTGLPPGGTASQYLRGDKTWQTLDKTVVGLDQVENTADLSKPVSTATQIALDTKENTITAGTTSQYWRGDKTWQEFPTVDMSNYVDLTTSQLINGQKIFGEDIKFEADLFLNQTGGIGIVNGYTTISGDDDSVVFCAGVSTKIASFNLVDLTDWRIFTLPDASGTIALTSDLTSKISGSLTTNYLPKAIGSTTLGNSLIYDNGTNVGIGTTDPTSKLHVSGLSEYTTNAAAISNGLTAGAFYHTGGILKVVI